MGCVGYCIVSRPLSSIMTAVGYSGRDMSPTSERWFQSCPQPDGPTQAHTVMEADVRQRF
jgi:hypothetical protein